MWGHSSQNRLSREKSPYLLQHANNPVDWYPWGQEAFDTAREKDKPIFLSIGYATCHWCHVMSHESFDDPEVATLMNETFINVKVDREEHPEIDSLYMEFAQNLMTSGSGWPLNVLLTPELKPFYAITYLPPETRQEMIGMKEFIKHIKKLWESEEKESLIEQANKLFEVFEKSVQTRGDTLPNENDVETAIEMFFNLVDPVYGGLKGTPKFPLGYQVHFFLNYAHSNQDSRPLYYVEKTLECMYRGGIYDHIGGGFSRYSVDEKWMIPHFEKMLCDNAILVGAYLDAWRLTKDPFYKEVTEDILNYVIRDMRHPEGGFYSAEDADSEGEEGKFYVWTDKEVKTHLSPEDFDLFSDFFDVTAVGNFEGKNVLHCTQTLEEFAELKDLDPNEAKSRLDQALNILFEVRKKRIPPFKDDKILVSWNGLIIHSLVQAGFAFNRAEYLEAGKKAAEFIYNHCWKDGKLLRRYREGQVDFEGNLEDYAYLIRALLTLFEADQGTFWLKWSLEMVELLENEFKADEGAFYQTGSKSILLRRPELYDGAEPSGNAIHCENLLRLSQMTYNREYRIQAEDILKAVTPYIETYPTGVFYHLITLQRFLNKNAGTIIIALDEKDSLKYEISALLGKTYLPHDVIIWKHLRDDSLLTLCPYLEEYIPISGKTTLYRCYQGKCQKPLATLEEIQQMFKQPL